MFADTILQHSIPPACNLAELKLIQNVYLFQVHHIADIYINIFMYPKSNYQSFESRVLHICF